MDEQVPPPGPEEHDPEEHGPVNDGPAAPIDPLLTAGFVRPRRWIEIVVTLIIAVLGFLVLYTMSGGDAATERSRHHETVIGGDPTDQRASCAAVAELVDAHGLPETFVRIAWRESRCQAWQVNLDGEASYGLFQINTRGRLVEESRLRCGITEPEELLDPVTNVRCAAALYAAYGERPWRAGRYFR